MSPFSQWGPLTAGTLLMKEDVVSIFSFQRPPLPLCWLGFWSVSALIKEWLGNSSFILSSLALSAVGRNLAQLLCPKDCSSFRGPFFAGLSRTYPLLSSVYPVCFLPKENISHLLNAAGNYPSLPLGKKLLCGHKSQTQLTVPLNCRVHISRFPSDLFEAPFTKIEMNSQFPHPNPCQPLSGEKWDSWHLNNSLLLCPLCYWVWVILQVSSIYLNVYWKYVSSSDASLYRRHSYLLILVSQ